MVKDGRPRALAALVPRAAAMRWLLFAAMLPSLTFLGHWPLRIDVPGTNLYVGLPETADPGGHDHTKHCHADAASCSDTPLTTTASIGMLADSLSFAGVSAPLIPLTLAHLPGADQAHVGPMNPPPKAFQRA